MVLCLDPHSRIAQPRFMNRTARRTALGSTTAIGMSFVVFLWSPGAVANGCDTTPSIGQTIVCDAVGTETIAVPTGANAIEVVVIGGGGGGGGELSGTFGGAGGSGASASGTLTLSQGTTLLNVKVGGGGAGQNSGGQGGDFSRLQTNSGVLLALAGGGGGGGFADPDATGGDGSSSQTGAGGDGGDSQKGKGATGGSGGSAGLGGAGGEAKDDDDPTEGGRGSDYADDGEGAGGLGDGTSGGFGGDGYGGGGGGGSGTSGRGGGGAGGSYVNTEFVIGSAVFATATGIPGSGGAGGTDGGGESGQTGSVTITFIIIPTPSTASSAATPRAISLDFTLPTGIECRFDSVEASLGSWIELPGASDCTITTRTTDTQPTLLGWATNADFPIDIAQRQIDNGWGAYETFNNDGQLTGVFIPAGGYTMLSSDINLHPIWAN